MFRQEAIDHSTTGGRGVILLVRPIAISFIVSGIVVIVTAIVFLLFLASYQRKVHVAGLVLPRAGIIRIAAPQGGMISKKQAGEGREVAAGEPLWVITNERPNLAGGDADKIVNLLLQRRRESLGAEMAQQVQQSVQRMDAATKRAEDLEIEGNRLRTQVSLQMRRVTLADEAYERIKGLQRQGFVSQAQVDGKEAELAEQNQRLAELQRSIQVAGRELSSALADVRDIRIQSLRDQETAKRNIAAVDQEITENEARQRIVIVAPQEGILTAVSGEVGQMVAANQSLGTLLPKDSELVAELYAPSRAAGFIKPGTKVLLRYAAFPYQKFGQYPGVVEEVSHSTLSPGQAETPVAEVASKSVENNYRIRVVLDSQAVTAYGKTVALKPGMSVEASVLLDRRRLYEWALEPLLSIAGRV